MKPTAARRWSIFVALLENTNLKKFLDSNENFAELEYKRAILLIIGQILKFRP